MIRKSSLRPVRRVIDSLGATSSVRFRRELECPGENEGNRKADRDQHDHQPHDPIWNLQEREDLRGNLNHEPADNRISDRNLVNVAPF